MTQKNAHKNNLPDDSGSPELSEHNNNQTFLTESDLAIRWRISVKKLQSDRIDGCSIPYTKIGRLVRYRLSDVIKYENSRQRKNTSDQNDSLAGSMCHEEE